MFPHSHGESSKGSKRKEPLSSRSSSAEQREGYSSSARARGTSELTNQPPGPQSRSDRAKGKQRTTEASSFGEQRAGDSSVAERRVPSFLRNLMSTPPAENINEARAVDPKGKGRAFEAVHVGGQHAEQSSRAQGMFSDFSMTSKPQGGVSSGHWVDHPSASIGRPSAAASDARQRTLMNIPPLRETITNTPTMIFWTPEKLSQVLRIHHDATLGWSKISEVRYTSKRHLLSSEAEFFKVVDRPPIWQKMGPNHEQLAVKRLKKFIKPQELIDLFVTCLPHTVEITSIVILNAHMVPNATERAIHLRVADLIMGAFADTKSQLKQWGDFVQIVRQENDAVLSNGNGHYCTSAEYRRATLSFRLHNYDHNQILARDPQGYEHIDSSTMVIVMNNFNPYLEVLGDLAMTKNNGVGAGIYVIPTLNEDCGTLARILTSDNKYVKRPLVGGYPTRSHPYIGPLDIWFRKADVHPLQGSAPS